MPGDFDTVKERVDIVQLIGERVPLKKAGRSYVGLCPFHSEKTPSFHVDPDRRTYHCFGCSEQGDVFTWLEKQDGLTPAEALRTLAERAGVELTSRRAPEEQEREKRLLAANDTAHFYFRQALRGTAAGKAVAAYIGGRGIQPETVERFGLGYAPDQFDGLLSYLRKKGFSEEEAVAAGLVGAGERGPYDRFRDRLMVPIKDGRGRIVAFGGRAMRPDQPGKYVNSPQTALFNKSATLYGLDVARAAIRKERTAVIVEGYFDAIAMHQAGFTNTVASMGTALTEDQYHVLDAVRIERAVVAFDGDAAGQRSAEARGSELARQVQRAGSRAGRGAVAARTGVAVYVTVLPNDTDPDDLARRDPDRMRGLLGEAKPVLEFVIDRIAARSDLGGPEGRRRFLAEALPLVGDEPDPLTRELYVGTLSRLTGVEQESLRREAAAAPSRPTRTTQDTGGRGAKPPDWPPDVRTKQTASLERYVMALLTRFPEEAARADLAPTDLDDPDLRALLIELRSGKHSTSDLPAQLAATAAALSASALELGDEVEPGREIERAALRLREQNLRRRFEDARARLARGEGGGAGALDGEVAQLASELDELMKRRERSTVLQAADLEQRIE
ncbi:MAG: DNA primase [Chloroflexi bacterium]|nr:MAG: DNA primase [Chloroflexota bacterium]